MRETDTHVYFWGGYLSNFWKTSVRITSNDLDCTFKSSEQAYMAMKALHFEDLEAFEKISKVSDPKKAKEIGRTVKNFDPNIWDLVSYGRMLLVCTAKFTQNEYVKEKLRSTDDKILVEASPLDRIWGVGLHFSDDLILDEKNWRGENRLGKVLMEVRSKL